MPDNFSFQYPQALWLLALAPLLLLIYLLYRGWHRRAQRRMGEQRLVKQLIPNYSGRRSFLKFFLVFLAFCLGVLTLANPRIEAEGDQEVRKGVDLVLALDVSNSMLATDVQPSRLTSAKQLLSQIVNSRTNDRIALVLFAGHAYVQLPLTYDRSAALMFIDNANPTNIAAQGTALGETFDKCKDAFGENTGRYRAVILVTDGETHDEEALKKVTELVGKGVMINTVGIGSPEGSTFIDPKTKAPKKDESGNVVVTKLNEEILQQIATAGKGQYFHFTSAAAVSKDIQAQLANVKTAGLVDKSLLSYKSLYVWLALPMLAFLLFESFLPDRKRIKK